MNSVWLLCLSNIRKKKLQNGLAMLLIMLSTLLMVTAGTIIMSTSDVFTKLHEETKGSHQVLMFNQSLHNPIEVYQWWESEQGVTSSALMSYTNLAGISYHGEEIQNVYLYMMNTPEQKFGVDKLVFMDGTEALVPEIGTIWIPTSLAYSNGISIGDQLQFGTGTNIFTLDVSGIVIDLPFCAPFSNGARIWMNPEDYYQKIKNIQGQEQIMLGLRYDNYSQSSEIWQSFEKSLGIPYMGELKSFDEISGFYLIINHILGLIMIFLGVIMFLIALFTIKITITDAILSDYKTIGIIRSLGLTASKTIAVYVLQFSMIAMVAVVGGIIAGGMISESILSNTLSYIKNDKTQLGMSGVYSSGLVGVVVLLLVILFAYNQARKVKSIQPAQAIRFGMSEIHNSKMTKNLFSTGFSKIGLERYPVSFVIGIRNLSKNKKSSFLMILLTIMTSAVMVFGFLFLFSLANIQKNAPLWGYDSSHIAVTFINQSNFSRIGFEEELLSDKRIKYIGSYSGTTGIFPIDTLDITNDNSSLNLSIDVIDGSFDELGYAVIKGHNPVNKNEIALGINASAQLGKVVGDICEVYIEGKKHTLTIVGIYQSIANMSNSARITVDTIKRNNANYNKAENYFINLIDINDADKIVEELNVKYKGELTAVSQKTLIDDVFTEVVGILFYPMLILGLLFAIVTFIIIYSTCRINIQKESKSYGIYKSIGLTSYRIRSAVTGGVIVLSTAGTILGVLVGIYMIPVLMEKLLVNYGIVKLPLLLNWTGVLVVAVFTIVVAGIGSWLSSARIKKTSTRILVIE